MSKIEEFKEGLQRTSEMWSREGTHAMVEAILERQKHREEIRRDKIADLAARLLVAHVAAGTDTYLYSDFAQEAYDLYVAVDMFFDELDEG